jgi:hypothetical protein
VIAMKIPTMWRLAILAAMLGEIASTPARAEWNQLGETRELGAGVTPGIAVDTSGAVHVVFMHDGGIFHLRATRGGAFGAAEPVPVPEGPANYNSPHLVCDARGTLHVVFGRDVTGAARKAWYASWREGRWSRPVLVLDASGTERRINYPRLAISADGASAYVGGFAGGGSIVVRVDDLRGTPKIAARVETRLWVAHPLLTATGEVLLVGRAGASGHQLERYTSELVRVGEPLLLSRGTSTKTFEATAALVDERGVVHAVGATGSPTQVLWYNSSTRAAAGQPVIIGPELGHDIGERTYPVLLRDGRGRFYVSYRDHATGEARLTMLEARGDRFAEPVVVAPAITSRLRWNAHLAAAPGGGAYVVWDTEGRGYFRAVGEAAQNPASR